MATVDYEELLYKVTWGEVEPLRVALVDGKADVNYQDQNGLTMLTASARFGKPECVELLLERKADPNLANQRGLTALMAASSVKDSTPFWKCLKLLLQANADVNHQDYIGKTALTYTKGRSSVMFLLLCCGAEWSEAEMKLDEYILEGNVMSTKIKVTEYLLQYRHELQDALGNAVIVDTRIGRLCNGLYHEPLERVMQYCGLELKLTENDNQTVDFLPVLLKGEGRPGSALYWCKTLQEATGNFSFFKCRPQPGCTAM